MIELEQIKTYLLKLVLSRLDDFNDYNGEDYTSPEDIIIWLTSDEYSFLQDLKNNGGVE